MMSNAKLPILLTIPHAGQDVPPEVADNLAIDATTIYNECDLWADQLFDFAGRALAAVTFPIARVLIDANRPPAHWDNPDGAVKTQTSYGDDIYRVPLTLDEREQLQERYWQPFQTALHTAVTAHAAAVKLFLDCHNMAQRGPTAYRDPGAPRPFICIGNLGDANGDRNPGKAAPTCPPELARAAAAAADRIFGDLELLEPDGERPPVVALNHPFPGGHILRQTAKDLARRKGSPVPSLMVEINRGLFVGNQTSRTPIAPPNRERIAALNTRIVRWAEEVVEMVDHAG